MGQTASQANQPPPSSPQKSGSGCPVPHDSPAASKPAACPVDHGSSSKAPALAECPVGHDGTALNPLNQIPNLSQTPAPHQTSSLPVDRTSSSIPRDHAGNWDYPSPQQFYNALVRKGWETPEEHVEMMVQIHNFLNEKAWEEVLKWEKMAHGDDVRLARFKGRPGELSPKARFYLFAGWLLPSRFNTEPPFDRHDWVVQRPKTGEEVRYVIDYYSAPPEPDGSPVFSLDVRPALDSVGSIGMRMKVATEEAWRSFREKENGTE
ncbi:hypothetical protein JAAARDRAFT_172061 [Jaapia argillacea MUCL 33604]|uniref:Holocytochrome c-type synthase n=1 Tax=Jaapia argillacea MUCL 33604 TaxID=933084 RepID=A0A067QDV5_9AGAM|nr:hypothetical protein JAAARDRAFT_172061 [Jaapia argillacea MUCL 33604]